MKIFSYVLFFLGIVIQFGFPPLRVWARAWNENSSAMLFDSIVFAGKIATPLFFGSIAAYFLSR